MNAPKKLGTALERRVADYAAGPPWKLPWDRAPLSGIRDMGDIKGCREMGWLIECKALSRQSSAVRANGVSALGQRISEGMAQNDRQFERALELFGDDTIIPVTVVQRLGYPVGQAYVVMTYDRFLRLVVMRREWEA